MHRFQLVDLIIVLAGPDRVHRNQREVLIDAHIPGDKKIRTVAAGNNSGRRAVAQLTQRRQKVALAGQQISAGTTLRPQRGCHLRARPIDIA